MAFGKDETINGLAVAYIGGGSRMWAWELMRDLALEPRLSGEMLLYDIDYDSAKANEAIGNGLAGRPETAGSWHYRAVASLKEALSGADFVVISILPGTFDEMESDVHAPEKYGIYQSVGDTVGPGGVLRSMRTVPMYVEIAQAIQAFCPSAWVINYTNPMTVCTRALYRVFPGVKAFGCCHEVFGVEELLAKMLEAECGIPGVRRSEIRTNVLGVNHFTWFDKVSYKTMDLMPVFKAFSEKYTDSGYACRESDNDAGNTFRNRFRVSFDLFRRFGVIPAAGDRHVAEFMPPWYLKDPETVQKWGFALTPVSDRKAKRARLIAQGASIVSGAEQFRIAPSGEEGTLQMKALLGLEDAVTNVNMPNVGQTPGLPDGAVVETNAVFGRDSVRPVFAGRLPDAVHAMVLKHAVNQEMLVEAGIRKDIGLAFHAFLNDSLMTLGITDAERLFAEMVENTKPYLDGWKI